MKGRRRIYGPALPRHIVSTPDGLMVRVQVGGTLVQARVRKGDPHPLTTALRKREELLKAAAKLTAPVRSNTGITGVSETVKFIWSQPYDGFIASATVGGKMLRKFFRYGGTSGRTREGAMQNAVNLRQLWQTQEMGGVL